MSEDVPSVTAVDEHPLPVFRWVRKKGLVNGPTIRRMIEDASGRSCGQVSYVLQQKWRRIVPGDEPDYWWEEIPVVHE